MMILCAVSISLSIAIRSGAQPQIGLASIMDSIKSNNPMIRMYEAEIRSMDEAAKGARSWMPPELGAGFFMTPYNIERWGETDEMEEGMGNFMLSIQQMIANKNKLNADEALMRSMSTAVREQSITAITDLFAQAKKAYYEWVILIKKQVVVAENEKLLDFMIQNAEIRYQNGLDKINAYYKAKAALGEVQNMRLMLANEVVQKRIVLNTLMKRNTDIDFTIDTIIRLKDYNTYSFDSTLFITNRSDLRTLDRELWINQLRIESERQNLKPQFGIRFEHMFAFGGQPQQFTLMGMVRLPMVPWAAKMTKANMESYVWRAEAIKSQRQMIINEASGMASGMRAEIETKKKQVHLFENNIIPALRNNFKTMLLAYEQNTEELFMLFDAWETLNMTQLEYLDQLQQLLILQVQIDRIIQVNES